MAILAPVRSRIQDLAFVVLPLLLALVVVLISQFTLGSWWLELLSYFMPAFLVSSLVLAVLCLRTGRGWRHRWAPALLLLACLKPFSETVAFHGTDGEADLTVMSFNAALFNPYRPETLESDPGLFDRFYDHLRTGPSPDILCIQEFYHAFQRDEELTIDSIVKLGGYSNFYMNPRFNHDYAGLIGVATYSKFPAIASGRLDFAGGDHTNGHWNDFVVRGDTLRVVNVQLRSMSIRWTWDAARSLPADLWWNLHNIHGRLRQGYHARNAELDAIEGFLRESPYPVILCADINALPYSDTYQRLKRLYHNAFEQRGRGFGFTYHHFPWFIRIDNQFFSPQLGISHFRTRTDIAISDHYPVEAGYRVRARR